MASKTIPAILRALLFLLVIILSLDTIQSKPTKHKAFKFLEQLKGCHKGQNVSGLHELKQYLEKFGYFQTSNPHGNDDEFDEVLESAIKSYQQNYHLEVTGSLDSETLKQMMMPRCGIPDFINGTSTSRHQSHHHHNRKLIHRVSLFKFYNPVARWGKNNLTYRFNSSVPDPIPNIKSICAKAFQKWSQVSNLTFQEVSVTSPADIVIGFHRGNHGDGFPFDGRPINGLNTLAHAFRPTNGRLHFDAAENWSENPGQNQVDLELVAVHEIGHVLGLDHEPSIPGAIMYPIFQYGITKRNLHADDIQGIRALYP